MARIYIRDLQKKVRLKKDSLARCAEIVLKLMGSDEAELSILLVDDAYIRKLNSRYLKVDSSTDVLAFPTGEKFILGDVVISCETAERVAKRIKTPIRKELSLYLVHGILHLLGFSDKGLPQRKKMYAKQNEILNLYEKSR